MIDPSRPVHTVWIVDGLRQPKPLPAQILFGKRNTHYAVLFNGDRKVIGATAFFTELAAMRRWHGNLDRAAHDSYLMRKTRAGEFVGDRLKQQGVPRVYHGRRFA